MANNLISHGCVTFGLIRLIPGLRKPTVACFVDPAALLTALAAIPSDHVDVSVDDGCTSLTLAAVPSGQVLGSVPTAAVPVTNA